MTCAEFYSSPFLCGILILHFYLFRTHIILFLSFFYCGGKFIKILHINKNQTLQQTKYNITVLFEIQDDSASEVLRFDRNLPANRSTIQL